MGCHGYAIELDHENYILRVRVMLPSQREVEAVRALVRRVAPANLVLDVGLQYNTHQTLTRFTHGELAEFTHRRLRNEVFEQ